MSEHEADAIAEFIKNHPFLSKKWAWILVMIVIIAIFAGAIAVIKWLWTQKKEGVLEK